MAAVFGGLLVASASVVPAAEGAQCARVKIEIAQELTLERQAFDAEMRIENGVTTAGLEAVGVEILVTDEAGAPVAVTTDPNATGAAFFVRVASLENIGNVDGTGTVAAGTTAVAHWLLIPAPGAAGLLPAGKKYLVGARLTYRFQNEDTTLEVSPDVITVKPMPLLAMDYFLTKDVIGDNPFTAPIEPPEPFTLGVRVKNTGLATAQNLKIDSAQPKIVENNQGLLIGFQLLGSSVDDAPVQNTLLVNFGNIGAGTSKIGRWDMQSTLSGRFTEFSAKFSHADELGGAVTSLLQAVNTHMLVRDVRVDLPGRDFVRDFLAKDPEGYKVYESESTDTAVLDVSASASLTAAGSSYQVSLPAAAGFVYAKLPDPFQGQKVVDTLFRSDGKAIPADNVWFSKALNHDTNLYDYWFNVFDANTSGSYAATFADPPPEDRAPQFQFIPAHTVQAGQLVSFLVEASSAAGRAVTLTTAPLPSGATFVQQPADPLNPGLARATFSWTPDTAQVGSYDITYTAADSRFLSTSVSNIQVNTVTPPPGPLMPLLEWPAPGGSVTVLRPAISVRTSEDPADPTTRVAFEIYADASMTQLAATGTVDESPTGPTAFTPVVDLADNSTYWWRARSYDGVSLYSDWVNAHFFVNTANDPPTAFNLASPDAGIEVAVLQPELSWSNTTDIDGDALTYAVYLYSDAAGTTVVASATGLLPAVGTTSSWLVPIELTNHATYYWKVVASDPQGAITYTLLRAFTVNTGNVAPTLPTISAPANNSWVYTTTTPLAVLNATDADGDLLTYMFELDTVGTFDSPAKQVSEPVIESAGGTTSWTTGTLVDNQQYYWRAKAQDGRAESAWVVGQFGVNIGNQAPPTPTMGSPGNNSYTTTLTPSLNANLTVDPDGDAVVYEFEIYKYSDPGVLMGSGSPTGTNRYWTVTPALVNNTMYQWRVRARDNYGGVSAWSSYNRFSVATTCCGTSTANISAPATIMAPRTENGRKYVDITWTASNPYLEGDLVLRWSPARGYTYSSDPVIGSIHLPPSAQSGTYVWDVTDLPPDDYYIYADYSNAYTSLRPWAPGTLVVPSSQQAVLSSSTPGNTSETESPWQTLSLMANTAPTADVSVVATVTDAKEGYLNQTSFVWRATDWTVARTASLRGVNDCVLDGDTPYSITFSPAVSIDPNYIGVTIPTLNLSNTDYGDVAGGYTNDAVLRLCTPTVVSYTTISSSPVVREWVLKMNRATNTGSAISGATATMLSGIPSDWTVIDNTMNWGSMSAGQTSAPTGYVTIRSADLSNSTVLAKFANIIWEITTTP